MRYASWYRLSVLCLIWCCVGYAILKSITITHVSFALVRAYRSHIFYSPLLVLKHIDRLIICWHIVLGDMFRGMYITSRIGCSAVCTCRFDLRFMLSTDQVVRGYAIAYWRVKISQILSPGRACPSLCMSGLVDLPLTTEARFLFLAKVTNTWTRDAYEDTSVGVRCSGTLVASDTLLHPAEWPLALRISARNGLVLLIMTWPQNMFNLLSNPLRTTCGLLPLALIEYSMM